ncbi:MAG: Lar family restriction alleviation protein [Asticcacaulis sp.]|uniref:Lar family restriction alleviation protein n=1 Tax=Asticcacaulis sp. TaxID=1872648 RepID=UPI0039E4A6F0
MNKQTALKPCPFCGGNAQVDKSHGDWFAYCSVCDMSRSAYDTEERAADDWNNRPDNPTGDSEWLTEKDVDEIKAEAWQEGFDEGATGAQGATNDLWRSMVADLQKRGNLLDHGSEGEEGAFTADDVMQAYFDAIREAGSSMSLTVTDAGVELEWGKDDPNVLLFNKVSIGHVHSPDAAHPGWDFELGNGFFGPFGTFETIESARTALESAARTRLSPVTEKGSAGGDQ